MAFYMSTFCYHKILFADSHRFSSIKVTVRELNHFCSRSIIAHSLFYQVQLKSYKSLKHGVQLYDSEIADS